MSAVSITAFPREIIVLIFQYLTRVDVAKAARTCKIWNRCSKDPSLRWTALRTLEIIEQYEPDPLAPAILPQMQRLAKRKQLADEGKVPFSLRTHPSMYYYFQVLAENGEVLIPRVAPYYNPLRPYYYHNAPISELPVKDPSFIKWEIEPLPLDRQRQAFANVFGAARDEDLKYPVAWKARLMINIYKIETAMKEHGPRPWESWLVQIFSQSLPQEYSLEAMPFDYRAIHTPLERKGEDLVQPKGFQEGLTLHPYQLAAVRWMKLIESEVDKGFEYSTLAAWKAARTDVMFDLKNQKLVTAGAGGKTVQFQLNGGILADEMGLGKTIELCGLMLANPAEKKSLVRESGGLLPTKATLVLCPNHLAKQWLEELHLRAPALRAVLIATILDRRALTNSDILDVDVVVVSYNFLQNNNYNPEKKRVTEQITRIEGLKRTAKNSSTVPMKGQPYIEQFLWHRVILDEAHESMADIILQAIIFRIESRFKWYVSGTPFSSGALLRAARDWLSPDPPNAASHLPSGEPIQMHYQTWIECDLMLQNLYWRNTKQSVKSDWSIPNLKYETHMLTLQPAEQLLYDDYAFQFAASPDYLLQVCNGDMLFNQPINALVDRLKAEYPARILNCQRQIDQYKVHLKNPVYAPYFATYELEMEKQQKLMEHTEKLIPRAEKLTHWTPSAAPAPAVASTGDTPPAKGKRPAPPEEPEEEPPATTKGKRGKAKKEADEAPPVKAAAKGKRGKALKAAEKEEPAPAKGKGKKPAAKRAKKGEEAEEEKKPEDAEADAPATGRGRRKPPARVAKAAVADIVFDESSEDTVPNNAGQPKSLDEMVQQLGTKVANLLFWLRNLLKTNSAARIILFSAFSNYLNRIQTLLDTERIPTVHVEGNVHRKSKALREFKKDDEVRVILLCSERAAAGTNLMEASHVVLLDPMTGTKEQARAVESQAIGRAYRQGQKGQVTVVRFVVRNTLDHELYIRNTESQEEQDTIKRVASSRSQLVRTSSLAVMLADRTKSTALTRTGSITKLLETNPKLQ